MPKPSNPTFLCIKLEDLDWFTEELYFKSQALAERNWRLESKGLSPVAIDKGRLTQAVMNLLQNAVRHTQENDSITLGSAVRDEYAYLWVSDTGEGIATEDQERIFDRFARASDSDRYSPTVKVDSKLQIGDITLNLLTRQIWLGEKEIELSAREFILAETLVRHPMQVMSRQQLLDRIWGYDYDPGSNIVDVYIGHLRKKLGNKLIETVRGIGYRLRP